MAVSVADDDIILSGLGDLAKYSLVVSRRNVIRHIVEYIRSLGGFETSLVNDIRPGFLERS